MRVSRLVVAAVMLCIVMQTVTSRTMKFATLGDGGSVVGGGGSTGGGGATGGGNCTDRCNNTSGGGGGNTTDGGSTGTGGNSGPGSYNDSTLLDRIANCTTIECKLNSTRISNSGPGNNSTSGGIVVKNDTTLTSILSNYTDGDSNKNRTNTTAIDTEYQRKVESSSGTKVLFTGDSGLMKVQAPNSTDFVAVKLRSLSDSDGQKATNFENASWTWDGPTSTTMQGLAVSVLSTTGSVLVETLKGTTSEVSFHVEVLSFNDTGNFTYGDRLLKVDPKSIKISYNITGWPFNNDTGSFLYLAVTVNSNKNGLNATDKGVSVGNARVSAPTVAFVDEVQTTVDLFFSTDSDDSEGCQARLLMVFPQFSSRLYYDPIFTPDEGTTGTTTNDTTTTTKKGALGSSFSFITALLAVLLMLALYQF